MKLVKSKTCRGFNLFEFTDLYGTKCNIQESSLATNCAIWIGADDPNPLIMASKTKQGGTGWVKYYIPDDVIIHTRMHLSAKQVRELLPTLIKFAFLKRL